jgi:hypothetical protein
MKKILINLWLIIGYAIPALAQNSYMVHEWGTFTSVQGGNGRLQLWNTLRASQLPNFVNDWFKPGLNVIAAGIQGRGKGGIPALQRLETPVVYFYSDETMNADVSVAFPRGFVTEWYPLASQIGPSKVYSRVPEDEKFMSPLDASLPESRVTWRHLTIIPARPAVSDLAERLPTDQTGSHYFAARETDADYVQTDLPDPTTGTNETEKFLFYRGAGSFETPLHVSMDADNNFAVRNSGGEKLSSLFFVRVHDGHGEFNCIKTLPPGETYFESGWQTAGEGWQRFPLAQFHQAIAAQMVAALVHEGLFYREAEAMVNTWMDSWFSEEGTRVLYILPRAWTDGILPMTLNPQPAQLVRVMVGRTEIISPRVQTELLGNLTRAQNGDPMARREASVTFKQLGRFAAPALALTVGNDDTNAVAQFGEQLVIEALLSKN